MTVLYFDLDGTLVEYDAPFADIYAAALADLGVEPRGLESYSEAFFDVLGDVPDPFAAAIESTAVDVDPAAFSDALVAAEADHVVTTPGVPAVIERLREEYRLGVLTNGVGRAQRGKLDAAGLTASFDTVVVSGEVGARKPAPEIYRVAAERLPGDRHTFVADSLERDVLPAVEAGWRGIYVGDDDAASVPRITDLRELPAVLDDPARA